jgi:hypothetical protein
MTRRNYLRISKAASDIGVSSTLARTRLHAVGPPSSKAGRRIVVYDIKEADKGRAEPTPRSTNDTSGVCA